MEQNLTGLEKEGFIYIWYDTLRKMYYVGCHWGQIWDGYICSSNRMRDAYRRRPQDFKRRILRRNIPKDVLLDEEYKWLQLIPDEELGQKYYNLTKKHFGHWANTDDYLEISEKLSNAAKGRKYNMTEEEKQERGRRISEGKRQKRLEKESLGLPIRDPNAIVVRGRKQSDEEKAMRSESQKKAWREGRNTGTTGKQTPWTEERKIRHLASVKGCHINRGPKAYSEGNARAWSEGKYANRKSNNMKDFIWVTKKCDGKNTRIRSTEFDETIYILGRSKSA